MSKELTKDELRKDFAAFLVALLTQEYPTDVPTDDEIEAQRIRRENLWDLYE